MFCSGRFGRSYTFYCIGELNMSYNGWLDTRAKMQLIGIGPSTFLRRRALLPPHPTFSRSFCNLRDEVCICIIRLANVSIAPISSKMHFNVRDNAYKGEMGEMVAPAISPISSIRAQNRSKAHLICTSGGSIASPKFPHRVVA